ncbi:hypothetical protein [Chryseobacterium scophthalmum]|uniref:Metallo-peptidase family M12B Reprolysin-like n=1 Tax=Chryseobacterium scophthalmum TaxID=59733 RepID=A0A1N6J7U7_9FLAO|nr:hypothetical protein [Chryseobacterium scophthalmum]SIO40313.1 hypothetical protein SAMN05421769_4191 [Chryseobacterium scophthalmum]
MGKESFIGGDYIETTGGASKTYAGKNIENSSFGNQFTQNGIDSGVSYASNEEPPIISTNIVLKKFLIHFRRNTTYNGEFGFDWIRDEYIYPITNVGGTNKELSLDPTKLKIEYKTTDVSNIISPYGKDYYCSFLNLMLNQEVTLDIEVEELETLSSDATEILFESSNSDLVITPTNIALSTLIAGGKQSKNLGGTATRDYYLANNQVKVKCNRAFTVNEQIKIFAKLKDPSSGIEDKKEVGKMMVMKNSDQPKYTINVYVIKTYIVDDASFGETVIDTQINSKGGLQAFEDFLNKQSLNQGLIQIKFNYDTDGNPYDWAFRKISLKNASVENAYRGMLLNETTMEVDTGLYMNYINDRFKLMFPGLTRKKGIFLYLTPLTSPTAGGAAYNVPLANKHCIIFNQNLNHFESYAHEIGHTLGLEHFFLDGTLTVDQEIQAIENKKILKEQEKRDWFRNNAAQYVGNSQLRREHERIFDEQISRFNDEINVLRKNIHRFAIQTTENIMDYDLNNQKTFDKWQWKVIQDEAKQYYHE